MVDVDSAVVLPEVNLVGGLPACTVLLDTTLCGAAFPPVIGFLRRPEGEGVWFDWGKDGPTVHVRFPGLARFAIAEGGARILCGGGEGLPAGAIDGVLRRLLVSQVLPWAWSLQGKAVLHAGAVILPEGAVAFTAPSGRGKSTLTGAFGRDGIPVLADDALLLEESGADELLAFPGYPRLRLLPDSLAHLAPAGGVSVQSRSADSGESERGWSDRKNEVLLGAESLPFASQPAPLRVLFFLERGAPDADIDVTEIAARESYLALLESSFHLDLKDAGAYRDLFERFAKIARVLPARRLSYPTDLARLPEVMDAVREEARRLRGSGRS